MGKLHVSIIVVVVSVSFTHATQSVADDAPTHWTYTESSNKLKGTKRAVLKAQEVDGSTIYDVSLVCESPRRGYVELDFYDRRTRHGKSPRWHLTDVGQTTAINYSIDGGGIGMAGMFRQPSGAFDSSSGYANVGILPGGGDNGFALSFSKLPLEHRIAFGNIFGDETIAVTLNWKSADFKRFACTCAMQPREMQSPSSSSGDLAGDMSHVLSAMDQSGMFSDIQRAEMISDPSALAAAGSCPASEGRGSLVPEPMQQDSSSLASVGSGGSDAGAAGNNADSPDSYKAMLTSLVTRNVHYPTKSVSDLEEGTCYVKIEIARSGEVVNYELARKAGFVALDSECMQAVRNTGRFPPVPANIDPAASVFKFEVPINFKLK